MSDGALKIIDGTHLRDSDLVPPFSDAAMTVAQLLDLADRAISDSLFGLWPLRSVKSSAFRRLGFSDDDDAFLSSELASDQAKQTIKLYIAAIADELNDDPIILAVLDGRIIRLYLEDEDDFAMIAENLFTDLDAEDKGKICKSEIRNALVRMGVEMGVPPISEFPLLDSILKKHGADGKEELGQAQFAVLLQSVLQDLADALADKCVVLQQDFKIYNGSKLRKILADEKQLSNVAVKMMQEKQCGKNGVNIVQSFRSYLEKNGLDLGLPPPSEANEAVTYLYNTIFADVEINKIASEVDKDEIVDLVKVIIEKFAEQLEANPVYHQLDQ